MARVCMFFIAQSLARKGLKTAITRAPIVYPFRQKSSKFRVFQLLTGKYKNSLSLILR